MSSHNLFEKNLQEALTHLSDPEYHSPASFRLAIGCDPQLGESAVRDLLLDAIAKLQPPSDTPPTAFIWQLYSLLHARFVLKLTQEESADRLHVSRRTVNRLQQKAIYTLAVKLREQARLQKGEQNEESKNATEGAIESQEAQIWDSANTIMSDRSGDGPGDPESQGLDWEHQYLQEVDSLQARAPGAIADVRQVIESTLEIVNALPSSAGLRLKVISVQPELVAAVHPVILLQTLVSLLKRLIPYCLGGEIAIYAKLEDGKAKITLTGATYASGLTQEELTSGISLINATRQSSGQTNSARPSVGMINATRPSSGMINDITIQLIHEELQVIVWLFMPTVGTMTVLVVDDNDDMVRFYRDCTIGTRYNIVHVNQGHRLHDVVMQVNPDVIVLDVMLPDSDGWRLLMHLHADQQFRLIPVIISSVVREEELALSLGAASYLAKPVRPRQFIQALDLVCSQVARGNRIDSTN